MSTVNEKMTELADQVRALTNTTGKKSIDSMINDIKDFRGSIKEHPAGSTEGQYFQHSCYGENTNSYTFTVPFEPDAIYISSDAAALSKTEMFGMTLFPTSLSMLGGIIQYVTKSVSGTSFPSLGNLAMTATSVFDRYTQTKNEDGSVSITITPYINTSVGNKKFASGARYNFELIKYDNLTPAERVRQYIEKLAPQGGAITLNGAYITEVMPKQDWETLMSTRSEWTFTLWGGTYG